MTHKQLTAHLYKLLSEKIQELELTRDFESQAGKFTTGGLSSDEESFYLILNKMWDMVRESPYYFETPTNEDGSIDFSFITPEWIKEQLTEKKLSQVDLSKALNTSAKVVNQWISGASNPTGPAIAALYYYFRSY